MLAVCWPTRGRAHHIRSMLWHQQRSTGIDRLTRLLTGERTAHLVIGLPTQQQNLRVLEYGDISRSKPSLDCESLERELFIGEIAQQRGKLRIPLMERRRRDAQVGSGFLQAVVHRLPRHERGYSRLGVASPERNIPVHQVPTASASATACSIVIAWPSVHAASKAASPSWARTADTVESIPACSIGGSGAATLLRSIDAAPSSCAARPGWRRPTASIAKRSRLSAISRRFSSSR